jgi:hypothetical protein
MAQNTPFYCRRCKRSLRVKNNVLVGWSTGSPRTCVGGLAHDFAEDQIIGELIELYKDLA